MKKLHILSLALAAALASPFAFAQNAAPNAHASPDANGDGVVTRAEAAKAPWLASRFDQLDANKDGKLDRDELRMRRGMRGHGGMGGMRALDTDHDGRISRAEAQAGKGDLAGRFDRMDVNKDGYLDRTDMQLRMRQQRDAFFAAADADNNGKLSRDEFIVEQGARFANRAGAAGGRAKAPTDAERIQRLGSMFDRMDANRDGVLTKAEWDAAKPMRGPGHGHRMGHKPAAKG